MPIALLAGLAYAEESPNQQDFPEQPKNMKFLVEDDSPPSIRTSQKTPEKVNYFLDYSGDP